MNRAQKWKHYVTAKMLKTKYVPYILICHSSNEDIPQLMKDEVAHRISEHPPMLISGEIGAIETIEFIRYGERITANSEADLYERITGRRSSVFG